MAVKTVTLQLVLTVAICVLGMAEGRSSKLVRREIVGRNSTPIAISTLNSASKVSGIQNSTRGSVSHVQDIQISSLTNSSNVRFERSLYRYQSRGNLIDDCWRGDYNWALNRMKLADCSFGFGSNAIGGKKGSIYVVTDPSDDPINPSPGTLRYGAIQLYPLWIIFRKDMTITLKNELIMTSDKTIDGRGADVHIAFGPCITIQYVRNVIIHGLNIHDCKPGRPGLVRSSTAHLGHREGSDGDAISVFGSNNVWIDHNFLSNCFDGLVDVIHASTDVTISNNLFTHHDKVMLLGHNDAFTEDKAMRVTIAFNRFGEGCVQRMPRCRFGTFHILHNDYVGWGQYAIGGSADPTIKSEGNRFFAPNGPHKQVTKREGDGRWSYWNWVSVNDMFLNGAYFLESGKGGTIAVSQSLLQGDSFVPSMTADAGPLTCSKRYAC